MTPLIREVIARAIQDDPTFPEHFKWFDISDVKVTTDGVHFSKTIEVDLLKTPLPFDHIAIVLIDNEGSKATIALSQKHDARPEGVVARAWVMHSNKTSYRTSLFLYYVDENDDVVIKFLNDEGKEIPEEELSEPMKSSIHTSMGYISAFLESLRTKTLTCHEALRRKNHAKRIRQGKVPLFDWRTVVIQPIKPSRESLGGTHASPRLHDRRGHWRFIKKSQKRVWVRDCKVGDASKGVVFHDYKVKSMEVQ